MSDTNQGQSKPIFLIALVLLLFLLAGIQTWYLLGMKQQLDIIDTQLSSIPLQEPDTTAIEKAVVKTIVKTGNAVEPANGQQSSVQVKEIETLVQKPAQNPDKNVMHDKTPPLPFNDPIDQPFSAQARNRYDDILRMQYEMDRRFNQRFNQRFNRFNNKPDFQYHFSQSLSTPKMDVRENENQYTVMMNLPGADESDISVNLDGQRLTVKGKQATKKQNRNATGNMMFRERRSARFQRSITLVKPVIQNKMKVHLDNGVLVIRIPKVKY